MAILDKLMEKKDLSAYINLRLEYLDSIKTEVILDRPEKERGLIQERFRGRAYELLALRNLLYQDKIHDMGVEYFRQINKPVDKDEEESSIKPKSKITKQRKNNMENMETEENLTLTLEQKKENPTLTLEQQTAEIKYRTAELKFKTAQLKLDTAKSKKEYWEIKLEMARRQKETSNKILESLGENLLESLGKNQFDSVLDVFSRYRKEDD